MRAEEVTVGTVFRVSASVDFVVSSPASDDCHRLGPTQPESWLCSCQHCPPKEDASLGDRWLTPKTSYYLHSSFCLLP